MDFKTLSGEDISSLKKSITLNLDSAKANGFAGCNQYFSSYKSNQSGIEFSEIGSTKMFCEETMNVESLYLAALSKVHSFKVEGNKLQLLEGAVVLLEFEK